MTKWKYLRGKKWKIRTKLSVLMLVSAIISILLFWGLCKQQGNVWRFLNKIPAIAWDKEGLLERLEETAKNYDVPDSENDEDSQKAIAPFFALKDEYTGIYIYENEGKGLYRAGDSPDIAKRLIYGSMLEAGYKMTEGEIEYYDQVPMEFHNGTYSVMIYSYHALLILYPYLIFSFLVSVAVFLGINLYFINRRMKALLCVKDEILQMASGNLNHQVPDCGEDEIGILAGELDQLRLALKENIQQEEQSRKANQDLIAALSHDLRTPLTILNGYLEVLRLKRITKAQEEEYVDRCLQKTNDIKEMTDKMFEYALVYEEIEDPKMHTVSVLTLQQILRENLDFLCLAGFDAEAEINGSTGVVNGDDIMLKRIFSNLFSNILKYGDKKNPVKLSFKKQDAQIEITLMNTVKEEAEDIESNRIGLKSVEKIVRLHGGGINVLEETGCYTVQVKLPVE